MATKSTSTKTTSREVVAVSDWAKECKNLGVSFHKGYPLVPSANSAGVTPASILSNMGCLTIKKDVEKKVALKDVKMQGNYYYENKEDMLNFVRQYDAKYSKFQAENQPSNWLERKLVSIEDGLGKLYSKDMLG